tara:strand:+ start:840 stop:1094 length:255 start_codon:yes stop_codon:yes gene_type:complete
MFTRFAAGTFSEAVAEADADVTVEEAAAPSENNNEVDDDEVDPPMPPVKPEELVEEDAGAAVCVAADRELGATCSFMMKQGSAG